MFTPLTPTAFVPKTPQTVHSAISGEEKAEQKAEADQKVKAELSNPFAAALEGEFPHMPKELNVLIKKKQGSIDWDLSKKEYTFWNTEKFSSSVISKIEMVKKRTEIPKIDISFHKVGCPSMLKAFAHFDAAFTHYHLYGFCELHITDSATVKKMLEILMEALKHNERSHEAMSEIESTLKLLK